MATSSAARFGTLGPIHEKKRWKLSLSWHILLTEKVEARVLKTKKAVLEHLGTF
jgi:hypothetical protein